MKVYKYLNLSRASFLKDGLIRFSQPGALNDPYECLPAYPDELLQLGTNLLRESIVAQLDDVKEDDPDARKLKKARAHLIVQMLDEEVRKNPSYLRDEYVKLVTLKMNAGFGIFSLSRRWNSALMWSHYTKAYTGFCVGFDRDHKFFDGFPDAKGERFSLRSVRYSEVRTLVKDGITDEGDVLDAVLTKSLDWSYEEEERLVAFLHSAHKVEERSPYNVHLYSVPFDAFSELIVGHRATDAFKQEVADAAKALNIPAYETKVSDLSFDVERKPL